MALLTTIEDLGLALPATHSTEARATALDAPDIAVLVETYSPLLFRIANSLLRSSAESEDTVQDTFVRVLEHRRKLPGIQDLRVWLIRIAWNLALDRKRRIRPDQIDPVFARTLVAPHVPADRALAESNRIALVLGEIDRLPANERQVLLLSAMDELATAEIAQVIKKSESATRALLFRARARLRERLERKRLERKGAAR